MLTRLRVSGFKNLVDVDVRFGPFTCIAGPNGVGKSNLFDAIHFLSLLADRPLLEAARTVRGGGAGVSGLFHRVGDSRRDTLRFEAEMIVPTTARDDLRKQARATITFLRYSLTLALRPVDERGPLGPLEIVEEELRHIRKGDASKHLLFDHSAARWRNSVVLGERRAPYFLSTGGRKPGRFIQLHQDGGSLGRPIKYACSELPRTVVSGTNAAESPTALIARREMQSWRLLQLEPSALRRPDELTAPRELGIDGSHLAATFYRLCLAAAQSRQVGAAGVEGRIAARLAELVDDVRGLRVERDDRRGLLTLAVIDRDGTEHPAAAISDGSLRFLALAVLERDPESRGLICLEEPENGVHPERLPAMLELLRDLAVDTEHSVGVDNPLRQVIINTHSPAVVAQVPDESLLVARSSSAGDGPEAGSRRVGFHPLPRTWRAEAGEGPEPMPFKELLGFLDPVSARDYPLWRSATKNKWGRRRVADRDDLQPMLPFV